MGMQEEALQAPDTFVLPEYFITDVHTEIVGGNVRIHCGARIGNEIHWRYSVVMPADQLMYASRQCQRVAERAFNISQLLDGQLAH